MSSRLWAELFLGTLHRTLKCRQRSAVHCTKRGLATGLGAPCKLVPAPVTPSGLSERGHDIDLPVPMLLLTRFSLNCPCACPPKILFSSLFLSYASSSLCLHLSFTLLIFDHNVWSRPRRPSCGSTCKFSFSRQRITSRV